MNAGCFRTVAVGSVAKSNRRYGPSIVAAGNAWRHRGAREWTGRGGPNDAQLAGVADRSGFIVMSSRYYRNQVTDPSVEERRSGVQIKINTGMIWGTALPSCGISKRPTWHDYLEACRSAGDYPQPRKQAWFPGVPADPMDRTSAMTKCAQTRTDTERLVGISTNWTSTVGTRWLPPRCMSRYSQI